MSRHVRAHLTAEETEAARLVSPHVWGAPYSPGKGPMHWDWNRHTIRILTSRAQQWDRLAAAARVCAATMGRRDQ